MRDEFRTDMAMSNFRTGWLWSGRQFEHAEGLPFSDRGVRYGMALFETVRIRAGRPDFWNAHLRRLAAATEICGFALPKDALLAAAGLFPLDEREGVARVYVTAGDGAPADAADQPRVAVLFEERQRQLPEGYALLQHPEPHLPPFGGLKTANYWMNAESLRRAQAAGANEALLFNPEHGLLGACMGNVFLKTAAGWLTPSLECGARNGVVREWVLARLCAKEQRVEKADVEACEAMFLTNSWLGIMPVHSITERALDSASEAPRKLRAEWERMPQDVAL